MLEPTWPEPGKECCCIYEGPWIDYRTLFGIFIVDVGNRPGPSFMQILKIKSLELHDYDHPGHRLKLTFEEFPGEVYCACSFRPLEKIEDEETKDTTAPVDGELV